MLKSALRSLIVFAGVVAAVPARAADIVVGASVALTGKHARAGQEQLRGLQFWIEEVNARGGLLGRKVALKHYDDGSVPATGAKLYERLITEDNVDLLVGPYSSDTTLAASAVIETHGFPTVAAGAAASEIWAHGRQNLFGLYTPADAYMDQVLEFAKVRGLKRVAIFYENTAFPRDVARGARAGAKRLGMAVVFDEEYVAGKTDFGAAIVRINARKPDVIIGGTYYPDAVTLMRQARDGNLSARIFAFSSGPALADFEKTLGLDAEAVMGFSQWEPTLSIPGAREFAARYQARYRQAPSYLAAGGYAAGQILEAAVKQAGSLERSKLRTALRVLDTATVFGPYKVDTGGRQAGKPGYVVQWISGMRYVVLPEPVASRKPAYPFRSWTKR